MPSKSDGKIVLAGASYSNITGNDFVCLRYLTDGSLDSSFGSAGIFQQDIQLGSDDIAYSVAIQNDGKIVLAGASDNGSNQDAALLRLNTDGSPDTTFGTGGIVLTDFETGQKDEIRVVKIHPLTGNIVVGGSSIISSSVSKGVVSRYTSAGIPDSTFNGTGIRTLWVTSLDYQYMWSVEDLVVQPNGKISAVGWRDFVNSSWDSDFWALRINSDGSMDNTFSSDGVGVYNGAFNGHDRAYSLILMPNNDFRIAGGSYLSTLRYDFRTFELTSTGSSGSWAYSRDFASTKDDVIYGMVEDMGGNYVLAGISGNASANSFAIARIDANGSADNSFGTSGAVTTTFNGNAINECRSVLVQSDNKIVAAGWSGDDIAIARYLGDGIPQLNDFQLISPPNNSTNRNYTGVNLDWSDAYGATFYEVEIDTTNTFTGSPQTYTPTSSNRSVINLLPLTDYYWRVRASDGTNMGNWSNTWKFTTKDDLSSRETLSENEGLTVFPNPSSGMFSLKTSPELREQPFFILNIMGKEVQSGRIQSELTSINLQGQPAGAYFLIVGTEVNSKTILIKK